MDRKMEKKIVHLSTIHSITFESPTTLSPTGKQWFFIAKKVVLLTISLYMLTGKKPLIPSKPSTFIQKGRDCWVAQSNLWASELFTSNVFTKSLQITKVTNLLRGGSHLGVQKLLPRQRFIGDAFKGTRLQKLNVHLKLRSLALYSLNSSCAQLKLILQKLHTDGWMIYFTP